ncbi:MAG: glycoside hydrolase family 3 N-terminal domain-containing protein [Crocinitomicaceae bacterium]
MKKRYLMLSYAALLLACSSTVEDRGVEVEKISQNDSLKPKVEKKPPVFYLDQVKGDWADSVLNSMNLEEKVGQLFMVAAYSNKDSAHVQEITELVEKHKIGGLIFMQGGPLRQAKLNNLYQSKAKIPLLMAIDGEWGLAMRLDSTNRYPYQMTLGSIQDNGLIYDMGVQIAKEMKRIGLHVNFAPVIDVNNNRKNPVINSRSFGEDKKNVAEKGIAYMMGMQDNKVLACGKHFPGHGDTDKDSHKSLPIISHGKKRLDSLELYPFKEAFKWGLGSVMVAHLYIPQLDSTPNLASTLSKSIVTDLLQNEMKFRGLIFTDALGMQGVAKYFGPGEVDLRALKAGNDVLLFPKNVPLAIEKILNAVKTGEISEDYINQKVKKILLTKEWVGLNHYKPVEIKNLYEDLNTKASKALIQKLADASMTIIKNENDLLPLKNLDSIRIAYVGIGISSSNSFLKTMRNYATIDEFYMSKKFSADQEAKMINKLKVYDVVVVGIHKTKMYPTDHFGVSFLSISFMEKLAEQTKVVCGFFANPYALDAVGKDSKIQGLILAHQDNSYQRIACGNLIFGSIKADGRIPVSASAIIYPEYGMDLAKTRMRVVEPEYLGINPQLLARIDSVAQAGIAEQAYPGCQILASKDGDIFYNKVFGSTKYKDGDLIREDHIYDIASITKVVATTLSLMKLTDEKKFDVEKRLVDYIPELVDSTKYANIKIKDMLTHQARLQPWIPFYLNTIQCEMPDYRIYSVDSNKHYSQKVADNFFIIDSYKDSIFNKIIDTKLRPRSNYKYSDLGYYFLKEVIQKITKQKLEDYVAENFYKPMNLKFMGYHPKYRFKKEQIVPTEYDSLWRKQLVQGDVHDMGAAMLGGAGGHAGIFSNSMDLAIVFQMLLNGGEYGGKRYLSKNVIDLYTSCPNCPTNRRGIGFDKPVPNLDGGPTCDKVSLASYGHTGFTGTMVWSDPSYGINYVFLSNRIFPTSENRKLIKLNIRTAIQEIIYDCIKTIIPKL